MNILVTGANGQLGSELKDLHSTGHYKDFRFRFTDAEDLDITKKQELEGYIKQHDIDTIINCAAFTDVDGAEENQEAAFLINDTAVGYLSETASENHIQLIHISTDYVFDGRHYLPYKETDTPSPQSVYGKSKRAGEQKVLEHQAGIIIRTAWLYSSYGKNFVKTISRLSKEKDELKVIYDQVGNPTHAGDLAESILKIPEKRKNNAIQTGIYHFANEGVCSWYDLAMEIIEQENTPSNIRPIESKDWPTLAERPHYSVFNKAKIKNEFGLTIPHWKESLKKMLHKLFMLSLPIILFL
ncbi:MAG: dTDP-4-dehydrorhamnose reductase [Bacteroidales bacterium]|nr:dTDP-4-dehydrorhamnose reductase [Bacteroidales bacterium]